jgi:hypothetical protein
MGLLDDDYKPPYQPPIAGRRFRKETALSQEERDAALNNEGRSEVTEDFGDSKFADRSD